MTACIAQLLREQYSNAVREIKPIDCKNALSKPAAPIIHVARCDRCGKRRGVQRWADRKAYDMMEAEWLANSHCDDLRLT